MSLFFKSPNGTIIEQKLDCAYCGESMTPEIYVEKNFSTDLICSHCFKDQKMESDFILATSVSFTK